MKKLSALSAIFLFVPVFLSAQLTTDFSGTWIQDKIKGDHILPGYTLTLTIAQTEKAIQIKRVYLNEKGIEEDSEQLSLTLDGKVVSTKDPQWITGKSAVFSEDRKELTIKTTQSFENQVVESHEVYKLSGNGSVLNLRGFNIEAREGGYNMVFNKK